MSTMRAKCESENKMCEETLFCKIDKKKRRFANWQNWHKEQAANAMNDTGDDRNCPITPENREDQPRECFYSFCKLALTSHKMHDVLREAMTTELKCELEQLRSIKRSFAGTCGIIAAGENTVCRSHRDSFTVPLAVQVFAKEVGPAHTQAMILRFGLEKMALGQWFIGRVHIITQNDLYVHCPDIEVTICKDGSDVYELESCIVMNLQGKKVDDAYNCTELEDGDKIDVRMLWNKKTYPLSPNFTEETTIFPIEIKTIL